MSKKRQFTGLILGVILVLLLASSTTIYADSGWNAKYWNNTTLSGDPVLQRTESELNHDWGHDSPHQNVNSSNFSARWKRTINVSAGAYRFTATMDDGMRVWVDGALIIDSWWDSQEHSMSADISLTAGNHEVEVKYYDVGGVAVAKLQWVPISGVTGAIYSWRGEYFNNTSLSGSPVMVRDDQQINFNWGGDAPKGGAVPADQFSVRWTRNVNLNAGRYRFTTTTDDGVRLWVNNTLIIDQWHDQASTQHTAEINLPGGDTPIKMAYYENHGGAVAQLSWAQTGGPSITHWRGEYFNNNYLGGTPTLVRNDAQIDFDWGRGSPGDSINSDAFSVRWTRDISINAGRYRFSATTDDGVRLWVNNQLIIDKWYDRSVATFSGEIDLPGGSVPVKMEFYERAGLAEAHLTWTPISASAPQPNTGGPNTAVVTANRLNVRRGPGTGYGIVTTTTRDTAVTLTQRNNDASWVGVILPDGVQGWVSARYLNNHLTSFTFLPMWNGVAIDDKASTATVINAYRLNVRSGPGTSYSIVTVINQGQVVSLTGEKNANATWVKITLTNGVQGWVNAYYLG